MNDKNIIKKEILIYCYGYLLGIKNDLVKLNEKFFDEELNIYFSISDTFLNVRLVTWLEKNGFDQEFYFLIDEILELDSILDLIPEQFDSIVDELIEKVSNEIKKLPIVKYGEFFTKSLSY
jgi:hypothetical protein